MDETICNLCGLPCTAGKPGKTCGEGEEDHQAGLIEAAVEGGYESTPGNGDGALDDMTSYHFSLCEFCLDWLFLQFKIPVKVLQHLGGGKDAETVETTWRPAEQRVREDEWRGMKDVFATEKSRRDLARVKTVST